MKTASRGQDGSVLVHHNDKHCQILRLSGVRWMGSTKELKSEFSSFQNVLHMDISKAVVTPRAFLECKK